MNARAGKDVAAALLTPAAIRDPYPIYSRLRETAPVYWSPAFDAWIVTSYAAVREVLRSHDRFSSALTLASQYENLPADVKARVPTVDLLQRVQALPFVDPPRHAAQRTAVMRPLSPRQLESKRPWLADLCGELAAGLSAWQQPDLIPHFSAPLSNRSLLALFGAPLEHTEIYQEARRAYHSFLADGGAQPGSALRYERAAAKLRAAIESVSAGPADPDDDTIISSMVNRTEGHAKLSPDEIFAVLRLFFTCADENIIYSIPTALHELLRHPDQHALVVADPARAAAAYEEAVRFDTPTHYNVRVAAADTVLGDQKIARGSRVMTFKAAANRDPEVWTDPDVFDIGRDQSEPSTGTIAFGQGIHFCVGAGVARLEGPMGLATLIQRYPAMRLVDGWEPRWQEQVGTHKLAGLPLELD